MGMRTSAFAALRPDPTLATGATARSRLHTTLAAALCAFAGCLDSSPASDDVPTFGQAIATATVQDYVGTGCSTAVVIGLSKQIAQEANCQKPGAFIKFAAGNGVTISSNAVLPYLEMTARADLLKVAAGASLQINSALRTLAQQYLLYHWYLQGRCGITAAADVGASNHEGGRAVDLQNYSSRISQMGARGWKHDIPGDAVHFDHTASPDARGYDVRAFQTLWNRNHPDDLISVDGDYGSQTESRLEKSPATGFALGASCVGSDVDTADIKSVDGPDRVGSGAHAHYAIALENTGATTWPDTTKLVVSSGAASPLYDASTWTSETQIGTLPEAVASGKDTTIGIEIVAPAVSEDTPIDETIALMDGASEIGTFELALTVTLDGGGTSSDGNDENDDGGAGCNASGSSSSGLALIGLALIATARRGSAGRWRSRSRSTLHRMKRRHGLA